MHSQTIKLSQIRPESGVYLQPIDRRSADSTLVREEANGVQQEGEAEECWQGFKPLQEQERSTQEGK